MARWSHSWLSALAGPPLAAADLARPSSGKPKVLRAAQRGAACKVDLSDHWDPFALADAPLEQIRAEYGVAAL